jgi:uncharacterized protein YxjI
MGFLRRHEEENGTRYQMREKLLAIGDDFWIETEGSEKAFKVDGKALRVRSTFILKSPDGEDLYKIQKKELHIRDTMEIERDGEKVATIKKALITPLGSVLDRGREWRRAEREGEHRRPRIRDRARWGQGGGGLQALVSGA